MTPPRVLMLGWEFPPLVNGGLGVASMAITKALAPYSQLTVMLPKIDPATVVNEVELIGLDQQTLRREIAQKPISRYATFSRYHEIDVPLLPYATGTETLLQEETTVTEVLEPAPPIIEEEHLNGLWDGQLYGPQLGSKVKRFALYAAELAQSLEFDVIHAHDWMTWLAAMEIKQQTGKPVVLHVHSTQYDRTGGAADGWIFELEKHALLRAEHIITVSDYTASVLSEYYDVKASRISTIYNGVEAPEAQPLEPKAIPEKLVLFLGRITTQKGPEQFLEIAQQVFDAYPNVRFVMAGTGDHLKRIIEAGAYQPIASRMHFTGHLTRQEVQQVLSMADVYCMPSVSEPFGLSALEAAQAGVPVVLSKQSGVAEVLPTPYVADHWDTEGMANHIISILKQAQKARAASQKAATAAQELTWEKAAKGILNIYNQLLA